MTVEVTGMIVIGLAALLAGLILARVRFLEASGVGRVLVAGPICEAAALAMFAAEHFLAARDLMPLVPQYLPGRLFLTYFVGAALLAAAVSFIAWRYVRWSAALLALLFIIIVASIDLPNLPANMHERLFWTLTVRELAFAAGAMVLAGSTWHGANSAGILLVRAGRSIVAATMIFYGIQHFFFPLFVPGVPLEKLTPSWMPAPKLLAYFIGISLLLGGAGLLVRRTTRIAAAATGTVLLLLTVFFYIPILATETHSVLAVEGMNYVGDTLLFAATVLLAGRGTNQSEPVDAVLPAPSLAPTSGF